MDPRYLEQYGAFDISLVTDLPLFIDPFLLFNSQKKQYQELHKGIIRYLRFLSQKASPSQGNGSLISWYSFKEVEHNWFGFSLSGNKGSALGIGFAKTLNENLYRNVLGFGGKIITQGRHLEKLCLIKDGVGKDKISDFATNLIKEFLLEYTQDFAKTYIAKNLCSKFRVPRTRFNYTTETWEERTFVLPKFRDDFVILTPKDLLTKDETWINKNDLVGNFSSIPNAIDDDELRFNVNNYFLKRLAHFSYLRKIEKQRREAARSTILKYPQVIDYYIKLKEESGEQAESISNEKVYHLAGIFVKNAKVFIERLSQLDFFPYEWNSYDEAKAKVHILKAFIENNDGYQLFYHEDNRIYREKELQLLFHLVCRGSNFDVNREVNNGRGPADFIVSQGSTDKTVVEFKLASNSKLKQNLRTQTEIYEKANDTEQSIKVIVYFTESEYMRAKKILKDLGLDENANFILIDARNDNKPSASNA